MTAASRELGEESLLVTLAQVGRLAEARIRAATSAVGLSPRHYQVLTELAGPGSLSQQLRRSLGRLWTSVTGDRCVGVEAGLTAGNGQPAGTDACVTGVISRPASG